MRIRPIRPGGIDLFIEAGPSQQRQEVRQYVKRMFAAGSMHPEWCFILEDGEQSSGRVALWTLPGMQKPLDLVLLDLHWDKGYLEGGTFLLRRVLEEAREAGAENVGHIIDAPPMQPQWQYRQAETLDREIQREIEEYGPERAGRELFELEKHLEHEPSWWHLAYSPEGELAGLIISSKNPTSPVIGYIGVVPEHRGKGYVDDLLAKGTRTLLDAGAEYVRADTDVHNSPMAAAFRRAGYSEFARRRAGARQPRQPVILRCV